MCIWINVYYFCKNYYYIQKKVHISSSENYVQISQHSENRWIYQHFQCKDFFSLLSESWSSISCLIFSTIIRPATEISITIRDCISEGRTVPQFSNFGKHRGLYRGRTQTNVHKLVKAHRVGNFGDRFRESG